MRFRVITILLVVVLAAAAGAGVYFGMRARSVAAGDADALGWLWTEFRLSDEQMGRIAAMHAAYEVVCERHCEEIAKASGEVRKLRTAGATEAELKAAEARAAEVDAVCRAATEAHVRAVAAIMGERQGGRYLALVLPKLGEVAHSGAPDLRANSGGEHHGH